MSSLDEINETISQFLHQSLTDRLHTSDYPSELCDCSLSVSFGQGNPARVPWIAFLIPPNVVRRGIFPVALYFKERNLLILSYGVSEQSDPAYNWHLPDVETIEEFFQREYGESPPKYGSSYVFKTYQVSEASVSSEFAEDLINLTSAYSEYISAQAVLGSDQEALSITELFQLIENSHIDRAIQI